LLYILSYLKWCFPKLFPTLEAKARRSLFTQTWQTRPMCFNVELMERERASENLQHTATHCNTLQLLTSQKSDYGVPTISRLLKIIGLFCRISSLLWVSFAKETYNLKEPTNRSHPISYVFISGFRYWFLKIQTFICCYLRIQTFRHCYLWIQTFIRCHLRI